MNEIERSSKELEENGMVFSSKELQEVVDRQIDMVIDSVYGLFFSADSPSSVSFYDILNRIMLLLQAPVTFVLGQIDPHTKKFNKKDCISFNKHSFHQEKIEKALDKAIDENTFFKVFGTEYRLLVLLAKDHNHMESYSSKYDFTVIWKNPDNKDYGVLYYKLSKVLDESGTLYKKRFEKDFLPLLKKVLNNCKNAPLNPINSYIDENDKEDYQFWYKKFIKSLEIDQSGYKLKHDGVIDKAYKKSKAALLKPSDNNANIPNFIFFLRDYSENKTRCNGEDNGVIYDGYPYGLKILICSEQKKDITRYFYEIRRNKEIKNWYLDNIRHQEKEEEKIKPLNSNQKELVSYIPIAKAVHKIFWDLLNNEVDGITTIFDVLTKNFGEETYSFSDPVFVGGITHFRNPSVHGGLHRALPPNKRNGYKYEQLDEDMQNDLLRIVITHYLFLGMTGVPDLKNFGNFMVMLSPVEVGGRIIGVSGYVTINSYFTVGIANLDDNNKNHLKVIHDYSHTWLKNYHVYIDSYTRFKKSLRSYFLQLYLRMVADIYLQSFHDFNNNKDMNADDLENLFNKRCHFLTRFFSYSPVLGAIYITKKENNKYPNEEYETVAKISDKYCVLLRYSPKPSYFPVTLGREDVSVDRFVSLREIAVNISNNIEIYRSSKED